MNQFTPTLYSANKFTSILNFMMLNFYSTSLLVLYFWNWKLVTKTWNHHWSIHVGVTDYICKRYWSEDVTLLFNQTLGFLLLKLKINYKDMESPLVPFMAESLITHKRYWSEVLDSQCLLWLWAMFLYHIKMPKAQKPLNTYLVKYWDAWKLWRYCCVMKYTWLSTCAVGLWCQHIFCGCWGCVIKSFATYID